MTREELADFLDHLGTREQRLSGKPFTFKNLDELVFQLRKHDAGCAEPSAPCNCSYSK